MLGDTQVPPKHWYIIEQTISNHITHPVVWMANYTNTRIYNRGSNDPHNGHSGVFPTEQMWFTNK